MGNRKWSKHPRFWPAVIVVILVVVGIAFGFLRRQPSDNQPPKWQFYRPYPKPNQTECPIHPELESIVWSGKLNTTLLTKYLEKHLGEEFAKEQPLVHHDVLNQLKLFFSMAQTNALSWHLSGSTELTNEKNQLVTNLERAFFQNDGLLRLNVRDPADRIREQIITQLTRCPFSLIALDTQNLNANQLSVMEEFLDHKDSIDSNGLLLSTNWAIIFLISDITDENLEKVSSLMEARNMLQGQVNKKWLRPAFVGRIRSHFPFFRKNIMD